MLKCISDYLVMMTFVVVIGRGDGDIGDADENFYGVRDTFAANSETSYISVARSQGTV